MTDQDPHDIPEPKGKGLLIAGIVLLVVGAIGAFFAYRQADQDAFRDQLSNLFADGKPDLTFMWLFVVIAVLGVVCLIVRAATAARDKD